MADETADIDKIEEITSRYDTIRYDTI